MTVDSLQAMSGKQEKIIVKKLFFFFVKNSWR